MSSSPITNGLPEVESMVPLEECHPTVTDSTHAFTGTGSNFTSRLEDMIYVHTLLRDVRKTYRDQSAESRDIGTLASDLWREISLIRGGYDLPFVGPAALQKDLQGGASAKSQVISKKGDLFIKQADLELYKATGRVKWKLVPYKPIDFRTVPNILFPQFTPEQETLLKEWKADLNLARHADHHCDTRYLCERVDRHYEVGVHSEVEKGEREYELIRSEALTAARSNPEFNRWQLDRARWSIKKEGLPPAPPDDNCAWLAQLELMRSWFTQPGYLIIWQDKWGNLSAKVQSERKQWATQRPKPDAQGVVEGIEVETAKGARTAEKEKLDGILIRQLIGELAPAQAAKLEGVTVQKMKDVMKQRIFVLKRTAIESCGKGELKAIKDAVLNTYGQDGHPGGYHIMCRMPKTKIRVYDLKLSTMPTQDELHEALLRTARLEAFRMFWDKTDKRGWKALGMTPQTPFGDPKVLEVRKYILDKVIEAFNNGKIVDLSRLTPTSPCS